MMITLVLIGLFAILALTFIYYFNALRKASLKTDEAFAQIDVQLKRRADLIPNLIETVKGYAKHETETLQKVTDARTSSVQATTFEQKVSSDNMLTGALRGLLAISENYPDLKASSNFLQLQEELSTTENKIAFARQYYNDSVLLLNTKMKTIPSSLFVKTAGVSEKPFYKVDEASKEKPEVKF